jgi:PLP dependent protein
MDHRVEALNRVLAKISNAETTAGRAHGSVRLIAVSKTFDVDAIRPLLAAGHRVFGENRVQEAKAKWPLLRQEFSGIELHVIGPLQSNKAAEAVALFDVIQTVDRPKIADALAKEMQKQGRRPKLLVQVNTGDESQKAGIAPEQADQFIRYCQSELGLVVEGVMCIPPVDQPPAAHFTLLKEIAERHGLKTISMGMSSDFEEAIRCGATHVRVGSAIFGAR